jgi:hypothetical protein
MADPGDFPKTDLRSPRMGYGDQPGVIPRSVEAGNLGNPDGFSQKSPVNHGKIMGKSWEDHEVQKL